MATRRLSELDRFLSAAAVPPRALGRGGGGWTNYDVVVAVCGVRATQVRDPALFDAVSLKYGRRCETFAQAFAACLRGRRSLANMDLTTLRECHPGFAALQLPERIVEMQMADELGEWFERQAAEREGADATPPADEPRATPRPQAPAPAPRNRVAELEAELGRIRAERNAVLRQLAEAAEQARQSKYVRDLNKYLNQRCRRRLKMAASGGS